MKVIFKDGTVVEYPMATGASVLMITLVIRNEATGEIFAELAKDDVESWSMVTE